MAGLLPAAAQEGVRVAAANVTSDTVVAANNTAKKKPTRARARKTPTKAPAKPAAPAVQSAAESTPDALPLPPPPRPSFAAPTPSSRGKEPAATAKTGPSRSPTFLGAPPPPPKLAPLPESASAAARPSSPVDDSALRSLLEAEPPAAPVLAPPAEPTAAAPPAPPPITTTKAPAMPDPVRPTKPVKPAAPEPARAASAPRNLPVLTDANGTRLLFGSGAELSPSARTALDDLAAKLRQNADDRLSLAAYAGGTVNTLAQARRLSLARALAVRAYLLDQGVPGGQIDVRALGNVASADPPDRVDLVLVRRP